MARLYLPCLTLLTVLTLLRVLSSLPSLPPLRSRPRRACLPTASAPPLGLRPTRCTGRVRRPVQGARTRPAPPTSSGRAWAARCSPIGAPAPPSASVARRASGRPPRTGHPAQGSTMHKPVPLSLFFGKGSLLRNEPQYPTKGYAPHSGGPRWAVSHNIRQQKFSLLGNPHST